MYLTWRPGWPHLRSERVCGPLGYLLPWPLRQTLSQNIPLMISSSQSGRVSTLFRGGEDVKGRQHLLVCCLVELSAPAEQHASVWANPFLDLVAWWLSHTPDQSCRWLLSRLSQRWRRRRARVGTPPTCRPGSSSGLLSRSPYLTLKFQSPPGRRRQLGLLGAR